MVLDLFMRDGRFAESVASEGLRSESSCFLEFFCEFGGRLVVQNGVHGAKFEVSLGVFPGTCGRLFRDFLAGWAALGSPGLPWALLGSPGLFWALLRSPGAVL